jgi:hypothetical protein
MIDASFVPNINYVTRTIKTTKDLISSIEDDLKDVRLMMNTKLNNSIDTVTLIELLKAENEDLKVIEVCSYFCLAFLPRSFLESTCSEI